MQGRRRSVFATHRGTKVKRILKWGGVLAIGFIVVNHVFGGNDIQIAANVTVLGEDASHYGVEPGGVADADESSRQAKESKGDILSAEDRQKELVVAGYPANPFRGAASAASGNGASRLTINVETSANPNSTNSSGSPTASNAEQPSGEDNTQPRDSASTQPSSPSGSSQDAEPTTNVYDGLPDGDGTAPDENGSPQSTQAQSPDDTAASSAAVDFITKYTNYSAASTTADQFTQGLPNLTPDTRQQIATQTAQQWDRLARDQRVSQGKVVGKPSLSVPASSGKAIVVIAMSISEHGQTTNDTYRSRYTVTMLKSNNEWLVDGVTAQDN